MWLRLCPGIFMFMAIFVSPCKSQSFHPLGSLPGADQTFADAISADGTMVFGGSGVAHGLGTFVPIRWSLAGGLEPLATVQEGQRATAWDVAANGAAVVGQVTTASGMEAFRWTQTEGLVPLGDLEGAGVWSFAFGVSADGQTVVGHGTVERDQEPEVTEAFRCTPAGGFQSLGFLPDKSERSFALDVSADGSVIVGFSSRDEIQGGNMINYHEAFRWTERPA